MDQVKIYVYGSCHYSNRNAGFGVVVAINGKVVNEISGGYSNCSDPRIVIIGITEGIKSVEAASNILVYSANSYVINTLSGVSKTKKNTDLWQKLDKILQGNNHSITYLLSKEAKEKSNLLLAENLAKAKSLEINLPPDIVVMKSENNIFNTDSQEFDLEFDRTKVENKVPSEGIYIKVFFSQEKNKTIFHLIDILSKKTIRKVHLEQASIEAASFLAIVSALFILKENGEQGLGVYSNNTLAVSWANQKKFAALPNTYASENKVIGDITRAENWLNINETENRVLIWNEAEWGNVIAVD